MEGENNMKDKVMGVIEKFAKAMVQPLMYLSAAGCCRRPADKQYHHKPAAVPQMGADSDDRADALQCRDGDY